MYCRNVNNTSGATTEIQQNISPNPIDISSFKPLETGNASLTMLTTRQKNSKSRVPATVLISTANSHTHKDIDTNRQLINLATSLSSPNLLSTFGNNGAETSSSSSSDDGVSILLIFFM